MVLPWLSSTVIRMALGHEHCYTVGCKPNAIFVCALFCADLEVCHGAVFFALSKINQGRLQNTNRIRKHR